MVVVGAGGMGERWIELVHAHPHAELVGVADLDTTRAGEVLARLGVDVPVGTDAVELARAGGADAVVDVTVPAAHHAVGSAALLAGFSVLGEKPVAATVAQGLSLAAASQLAGRTLMTSQSRRHRRAVRALRDQVRRLGRLGSATSEFFLEWPWGGFRLELPHVLLVDMGIHPFDTARFVFEREAVAVTCQEYNPPWSPFDRDAAATAIVEFEGGLRWTWSGSWVAVGAATEWNSSWRIGGEHGSALWDGELAPVLHLRDADPETAELDDGSEDIRHSLDLFVAAHRDGSVPDGEVHDNIRSLAMIEAAVRSSDEGRRITLAEVFDDAYAAALADERRPEVRERLAAWGSAAAGLGTLEA